jgi:DNA-binding winged helix-turn-helix (wHTH) protein
MSFPAESLASGRKFRFGVFEVDLENRELRKHGLRIKLQRKPLQILELLLESPGHLVSRTELAQRLWPTLHVNFERSLNTAVNSLRRALGDTSRHARFIETRPGLGYRFLATVEEVKNVPGSRVRLVYSSEPKAAESKEPQDCLKGRYFCNKLTEEDLHKGIAHFTDALSADPNCVYAYAGLATAHALCALLNMSRAADAYPRAREMAVQAVRLAPECGESHAALAGVKALFEWDWLGAQAAYLTSLELSPASATIRQSYGFYLAAVGRREDSLRELRRAQEIDPLSPATNVGVAWSLYVARDFQGASEQAWKMLAMEPRFAVAQHILGLAYERMEMTEEAILELRNARTCSEDRPAVLAALAHAYARSGKAAEASATLRELEKLRDTRCVSPVWPALVYAGMGDHATALEWLDRAYAERDVWLAWLGVEPRFDDLRGEPRFQQLLRTIGLPVTGREAL